MLNEAGQQLGDDTNNAPARACNTRRMLNELRLLPGESAGHGLGLQRGNLLHLSNGPPLAPTPQQLSRSL